jgi:hypothetical protein
MLGQYNIYIRVYSENLDVGVIWYIYKSL